jgi:hypothetical protein
MNKEETNHNRVENSDKKRNRLTFLSDKTKKKK